MMRLRSPRAPLCPEIYHCDAGHYIVVCSYSSATDRYTIRDPAANFEHVQVTLTGRPIIPALPSTSLIRSTCAQPSLCALHVMRYLHGTHFEVAQYYPY